MEQFTLTRPGPRQYLLDRTTRVISVVKQERVLAVSLARSVVNVVQSSAESQPYTAAGAISGGRLVSLGAAGGRYYDPTLTGHAYTLLGVSLGAAGAGAVLSIQRSGRVIQVGWGLTPGLVYLAGANGFLVTTPPVGGFAQIVGQAIDTNTLLLSPQSIIFP